MSEDEARELFSLMGEEFSELGDDDDDEEDDDDDVPLPENYDQFLAELKEQAAQNDEQLDLSEAQVQELFDTMQKDHAEDFDERKLDIIDDQNFSTSEINNMTRQDSLSSESNKTSNIALAGLDPSQITKIEDLQSALPGMPLRRVKKILNAYEQTLGHPSMLTLIPILRETMPDYVSSGWLKKNNKQNADFALQKASEDGIVDSPLLNSMLEVKANSGSLNEALEYHEDQFTKRKIVSTKCIFNLYKNICACESTY